MQLGDLYEQKREKNKTKERKICNDAIIITINIVIS